MFISYTWDDDAHIEWVRKLSNDLKENGINVILDQWDLEAGDILKNFMKDSIEKANYVLIICTPELKSSLKKIDRGIYAEHTLILADIFLKECPRIYICLLRKGKASEALPKYFEDRKWLNFIDDEKYNDHLEQLVKVLLEYAPNLEKIKIPSSSQPQIERVSKEFDLPKKWIRVVGTGVGLPLSEKLEKTSQLIGELLASLGYGLITGGWPGVDDTVSRTFAKELERNNLPLEDFLIQIMEEPRIPTFPAGELIVLSTKKNKYLALETAIERADAIILVGGHGGTRWIGYEGLEKGKPVFPLADTGGDAKEVYLYMTKDWSPRFFKNIDKKAFQVLAREAPEVVKHLLPLLKTI